MSTMASGGFSTKNESLAYWNHRPVIQYIVTLFMFLAGTNFVLIYFGLKGKLQRIWQDNEFRWYIGFVTFFTLITFIGIYTNVNLQSTAVDHPQVFGEFESSFRHALFQVVAIITTTGFVTADFAGWIPFLTMLFFVSAISSVTELGTGNRKAFLLPFSLSSWIHHLRSILNVLSPLSSLALYSLLVGRV